MVHGSWYYKTMQVLCSERASLDEVVVNREALALRCNLSHCMQHHGRCARAPRPKYARAMVQSATVAPLTARRVDFSHLWNMEGTGNSG
ncbi:hypothetical protein EGR_07905 [Echinococcus granulosus]|uniref:Uncharacterized protein n=1 Tax=Echinococcus granulosus TaxID=6210 RepID=W6U7L7_ECHGR|nr:hypothetical protein EGR_07905 [Echinococcus granulosus]EUB57228.1 hypothetical protein EGR_07905 [Echinococcus granulosus]